MTKQTLTWREYNAIWLQGTRSKTYEPIALQLHQQALELGLRICFTHLGGCKPVNNSSKVKIAHRHGHWNSEMHFS